METQIILSPIGAYILLAIGIALIALESIITSFIIVWFGIGFILTAILTVFYPFSDGFWQLAMVCIFSLVLLFTLRKKMIDNFKGKVEVKDNFFNEAGIGQIKNSKVFYKGTYWEIESEIDENEFLEGEKVKVLRTYKNMALIKKL